jgi:hypothetical protein
MIIDAYNDIKDVSLDSTTDNYGNDVINVAAMKAGTGDKSFKVDDSGIWLGANKFADAPFSVDMEGNISATSLDLSTYISKTGTNEQVSGTIRLGTGTGKASIILDGGNKRIIVNDGTNDRILIGYSAGGF